MKIKLVLSLALLLCALCLPAFAQGTSITYQGRLNNNGSPANGNYDLQFHLRDAATAGNPVGPTNTIAPVSVSNGLFTVTLDFGAGVFTGPPRWLEIGVRTNGSVAAYATLSSRQPVTPSPYAMLAGTVPDGAITGAKLAPNAVNTAQLADVAVSSAKINSTTVQRRVTGTAPGGNFITGINQDGTVTTGVASGGIWSLNGLSAYYNGGNVGVGTTTPANQLTVFSTLYGIEHTDGNIRLGTYVGGSTGGGWLGTISAHPLSFFVNNGSASMTIETTGNVGIGTVAPGSKLEVAGNARIKGRLDVNSGLDYTVNGITLLVRAGVGDTAPIDVVDSAGGLVFNLIVGSPNLLQMIGNASKTDGGTSWTLFSDRRLKQDVRAYEPGLNEVLQLRPVRFHYRDDVKLGLNSAHEEVGFVAQEVRDVIPDAVTEGKDGYLMLRADPIHWAAINAIQELNTKLEEQRAENTELKQRLEILERLMNHKLNGGAK